MTSIVSKPLNRLRKHDSYRPLHARWGDVAITAPTEGSWCQYNEPPQSTQRRRGYSPACVPDGRPRVPPKEHHDERDDMEEENSTTRRSLSSLSSRLSLRPSRPKHIEEGRRRQRRDSGVEFAYKPMKEDYTTQVAEISSNRGSRFRYIPASPPYVEERETISPRSQSVSSYDRLSRSEDGYEYEEAQDRRTSRAPSHRGNLSDKQGLGLSTEKQRYASRRMTTVMVPDPKDIYG